MTLWSRILAWWRSLRSHVPIHESILEVEREVVTQTWYVGRRATSNGDLAHKLIPTGLNVKASCGRIQSFPVRQMFRKELNPDNACPRCFPDISERGWK